MSLHDLSADQLTALLDEQRAKYDEFRSAGLKLDVTRGKPAPEQLDLSNDLLTIDVPAHAADGTDVRNYGGLTGLPEIRQIFAELLNVPVDNLIAGDNSSLSLMHDNLVQAMLYGVPGGDGPWVGQQVKFICPVPGYDRHFAITEKLGIEMLTVDLGDNGPDLDAVERLLADPTVKGMWCVPMYANPNGITYDEATVRALLSMPAAAPDFRIWWDNAYALHHLTDAQPVPHDVISLAAECGNPDRVLAFASTSKITFAGDGISFFAASRANVDAYLAGAGVRMIGPDKVNQLRHSTYFGDAEGVRDLMRRHAQILAPKFAIVEQVLTERLADHDFARWTRPVGGYFVTLDVLDGTATRTVQLARDAGLALTPAGSSHPLKHDPYDCTIRIAPSFPSEDELRLAMDGLATCALLAALEKLAG